ncbi:hypothetical protein SAMN02927924_01674 [Sphingobium faniae]|nr:hypothetical protein SAMN02927924_01674 [Sphingobium faniae]
MIHVDELPVDIEEMREWANGYKAMENLSWNDLGAAMGIPGGTIQPFCKGNYGGKNDRIAREIFKFRQGVQNRREQTDGIPVEPGYFDTPTSLLIRELLAVASSGEITVGAFGPGMGKTKTAGDFLGRVSPCFMATIDEVSRDTNAMIRLVEEAIGLNCARSWPAAISVEIISFLRRRKATLIVDEANHLTFKALEQLRAWHDATGVGICLLGNEELIARIERGRERDAFARLNSRIAQRVVQPQPTEEDVLAFCDAWKLFDPGIRQTLIEVALRPGSGALRECRQIVVNASRIASEDGGRLQLAHVRWAIERRAIRIIRQ